MKEMTLRVRQNRRGMVFDLLPVCGGHPDAWGCKTAAEAIGHLYSDEVVVNVTAAPEVPGWAIRSAKEAVKTATVERIA